MKKNELVRFGKAGLLAAAIALVGATLTACHDHDDEDFVVEISSISEEAETYDVTVNTNVAANITFNGTTKSNVTTATFDGVTEGGTVEIAAVEDGYISQTANVALGANTHIVLDVSLVKRSTETIDLASADVSTEDDGSYTTTTEVTVSNDEDNQEETSTEASVTIDEGTTIENLGELESTELSTTVYVPAAAEADDDIQEEDVVESDVLVVDCTPDGAEFSQPVTIAVTIADAEGTSVKCVADNGDVVEDVTTSASGLSAQVDHFSAWTFVLNATVTSITTRTSTQTETKGVSNGNNAFTYSKYTGFTPGSDVQTDGMLYNFLKNQFGAPMATAQGSINITANGSGSVTYVVTQTIITYTYVSGSRTFTADVYGGVQVEIQSFTPGHSGGSGN